MGVFSHWTSNVKGQIERKFYVQKLPNFDLLGVWRSGGMKSSDFYPRDAMLARVMMIATCLSLCPSVRPSVRP